MKVRRKVAVVGAVLVAVGIGGAGSASAITVTLVTPNGKTVVAPDAAVPGAFNAGTRVSERTDAPPIDIVVTP